MPFAGVTRRVGKEFRPAALGRDTRWRLAMAAKQRATAARLFHARKELSRCPICGSRRHERFVTVFGFVYAACGDCGHIFCQTPLDPSAAASLYSAEEDERRCAQAAVYVDEELFRARIETIARPKAEFVASVVSERGVWVDVGCGTGELIAAAAELGWRCRGVESDPEEIAFGRRHGLQIEAEFADEANIGRLVAAAQVVSLINLLEHVTHPADLLSAAVKASVPGTYVVLEVPRHPSLSALANQAFPELACRHIYAPDHLHVFTEESAARMLKAAGLEAIALWVFGQDFQDLVGTVLAARLPGADADWRVVTDAAPNIQAAVDAAELSDTLFLIARKRR